MDSLNLALTYLNLGNIDNGMQNNDEAIVHYLEATKIFEKRKDSVPLAKAYANIGTLNAKIGNKKNALIFLEKSLLYISSNEALKMQIMVNISGLYGDKGDFTKALSVSKNLESLAKKLNSTYVLGLIYSNMCNYYRELKDYDTSITYGLKGLELKKKLAINTDVVTNNIGYSYLLNNQYDKAIRYFKAIPKNTSKALRALVLNNLKNAYAKKGDHEVALNYANDYMNLKDSLNDKQQSLKVASLTEKYESDKKQQQIDLLSITTELQQTRLDNQRNFLIGTGSLALLSFFLVYFWYNNQKTKQALQNASLQHKLLQTQLNPHFIFHALNAIQAFIYQNKKEESTTYLSSYSKLMRSILESSDQDFISVAEDSKAIEEYLNLQKLNFSDDIVLNVDIDKDVRDFKIPPMFVQPFVENALVHGISKVTKGKVFVHYTKQGEALSVIVSDNGKGIVNKASNNALHRSMSSEIIEKRILNLKKMHQYEVHIKNESNDQGTKITIYFPLKTV